MPSFTPNMPTPNQTLGQTNAAILNNFALLRTAAGSDAATTGDHYNLDGTNIGKHKWVHFPTVTSGVGVPSTGATETALYSKTSASTKIDLYYRDISDGTEFRLTTLNAGANFGGNAVVGGSIDAGWTFLPGGLILQYGKILSDGGGNVTITFPISFPSGNPPFSVQVTRFRSAASPGSTFSFWVRQSNLSSTIFQYINNDGHDFGFTWIAIGN